MRMTSSLKKLLSKFLFFCVCFCTLISTTFADEIFRLPLEEEYLYQYIEDEWIDPRFYKWVAPATNTNWINPYNYRNPRWINPYNLDSKCQKNYRYHLLQAERTYQDAFDECWNLSDLVWREIARKVLNDAVAIAGSELTIELVVTIINLLDEYEFDTLDEYIYIIEKLEWAQFHLDQCKLCNCNNFENEF